MLCRDFDHFSNPTWIFKHDKLNKASVSWIFVRVGRLLRGQIAGGGVKNTPFRSGHRSPNPPALEKSQEWFQVALSRGNPAVAAMRWVKRCRKKARRSCARSRFFFVGSFFFKCTVSPLWCCWRFIWRKYILKKNSVFWNKESLKKHLQYFYVVLLSFWSISFLFESWFF